MVVERSVMQLPTARRVRHLRLADDVRGLNAFFPFTATLLVLRRVRASKLESVPDAGAEPPQIGVLLAEQSVVPQLGIDRHVRGQAHV